MFVLLASAVCAQQVPTAADLLKQVNVAKRQKAVEDQKKGIKSWPR